MKQMIILSSICIALGLTACQKQPNPETGASTEQHLDKAAEQAKNDFKQTVDTVSAKPNKHQTMLPVNLIVRLITLKPKFIKPQGIINNAPIFILTSKLISYVYIKSALITVPNFSCTHGRCIDPTTCR